MAAWLLIPPVRAGTGKHHVPGEQQLICTGDRLKTGQGGRQGAEVLCLPSLRGRPGPQTGSLPAGAWTISARSHFPQESRLGAWCTVKSTD